MAGSVRAFVLLFYPFFCLLLSLNTVGGQSGTTPGIENIFTDRCNTFQKQNPAAFKNNPKNCTLLWELFLGSFDNRPPCSVTPASYSDFLLAANHTEAITDQAMFWAFVSPFVYNFTATQSGRYVTILDLLSGYILNDLVWCWNTTKNDLDYVSCPSYKNCPSGNEAVHSFWIANSQMFACLATGNIFAMLNGSTDGAYTNRSIFNTVEVPTMHNPPTTNMQVILVHNPGQPYKESCNNGTLVALKNDVNAKSISVTCVEDPPEVRQLQCQIYPQYAKYCTGSGASVRTISSTVEYRVIAILVLLVIKYI